MVKNKNTFQYLWPFISKNWKLYILGFILLALTNVLSVSIPYFLKEAIDAISNKNIAHIQKMAIFIGLTAIAFSVSRILSRICLFQPARIMEYEIRNRYFLKLLSLPQKYFRTVSVGDLMSRATNDLQAVRAMMGFAALNIFDVFFVFSFVTASMFSLSWKLALVSLFPFPIMILVLKNLIKRIFIYSGDVQRGMSILSGKIQENFNGIHIIKNYVQEEHKAREFGTINEDYFQKHLKLAKAHSLVFPIFRDLPNLILPFVIVAGGSFVIQEKLSLGTLAAFVMYLKQLAGPTMACGWIINVFQRGRSAFHRIREVLESTADVYPEMVTTRAPIQGEIEFKNVSFSYNPDQKPVLKNISFHIKTGSAVGILGKIGSGKTTLVQLLMGNEKIKEGQVLLDRKPIQDYPLMQLRETIGYVPQSSFLFSKTLKDNVYFGAHNIEPSEKLLHEVTTISHLKHDVDLMQDGFNTTVGEKGITLSGGQQQRAALSRAIIGQHQIYIFDDSFSHVDHDTEESILKNLKNLLQGKTTIFISHRISTLKLCDFIIYLENGEIAESGTHRELITYGKQYYRTYALQNLEAQSV